MVRRRAGYSSDPLVFRPDRSLSLNPERPKLAYSPIGARPRLCLGRHLAKMEGATLLAVVHSRHRLSPVAGRTPHPSLRITLEPRGGVWLDLERV